jgi:NAD(P)-dependent dehydrogenase (short-subunit alcohol dehydrogenase family)
MSLFDFAKTVFGNPPDIVIANAGVTEVGHLEDDVVLGQRASLYQSRTVILTISTENELGAYPQRPRQTTLDVNLAGAILTAETARVTWAQYPAQGQRKLILISSMGSSLHRRIAWINY